MEHISMTDIIPTLVGISPATISPKENFYRQAQVISPIVTMTADQTRGLLCQIGYLSSQDDYSYIGPISGRLGKYQFDYIALQSLGIAKDTVTSNMDFRFGFSWVGIHGKPGSTSMFLSNVELQDGLALTWAKSNYESLYNLGGITSTDSVGKVAGMLAIAHFVGPTLAKQWRNFNPVTYDLPYDLAQIYMAGRYGVEMLCVE
jgi:hypothetical protein